MANPKIIYPTQPPAPAAPSLLIAVSGAQPLRTYFAKITFVTIEGETLPSPEATRSIPANDVLYVSAPVPPPSSLYVVVGWNIYVSTATGTEQKQNASPILLSSAWQEPDSGLVAGASVPVSWGATLSFNYPPRNAPYSKRKWIGTRSLSTAGILNSLKQRTDSFLVFDMQYLRGATDAPAWDAFLQSALDQKPFDYYPDSSLSSHTAYLLDAEEYELAWKAAAAYGISQLAFRVAVADTQPSGTAVLVPASFGVEVPFTTPNGGNFTLAHGLGRLPVNGFIRMTSGGDVWFQTPTMWDALNAYLVATAPALTGQLVLA